MSGHSIADLRTEARAAAGRGDAEAAKKLLTAALGRGGAREEEYVAAASDMTELLARMKDARGALTASWYAGTEKVQLPFFDHVPPVDRARTILGWAERATTPERAQPLYVRAADEYESAGLIARAAIARERAEDFPRARALWSRLSHVLGGSGADLYAAGLARFNLARAAKRTGDAPRAREATVAAVHLLEEAADRYGTMGQRERAFDCYQVLIAIGRESGEFEHVLEGYVNVIRILSEDHLRYYALQSYEDAVAAAEKQGESAAAATLAREMAAYARKEGLSAIANHGMLMQARLWRDVARKSQARDAPPEIAENALLAAVIAYGESAQFRRVAELYDELAKLPLTESRAKHYGRAMSRYAGATDLQIEASALPAHLRHDVAFPEVWHDDLVEWEQRGSAAEACADIVLSPSSWDHVPRRRALVARLSALSLEAHLAGGPTATPGVTEELAVELAKDLGQIELFVVLSALEHLLTRPEPKVRAEVMKALGPFRFKRTFVAIRQGLSDPDPTVATAAATSLEELKFPHAFDPLARIYRESQVMRAKKGALVALANVDTVEAAEMMLSVVEHDGPEERAAAVAALRKARSAKFPDLARRELPRLRGAALAAVEDVLRARQVQF